MKRTLSILLFVAVLVSTGFSQYGAGPGSDRPAGATAAQLKSMQKERDSAKAAFTKTPKNAAAKKRYLTANNALATATMMSEAVDRKLKYKIALRLYRETLKVDPKDKVAAKNSEMIISIYKSMGRPIPN